MNKVKDKTVYLRACLQVLHYARELGRPCGDLEYRVKMLQREIIYQRGCQSVESDTVEERAQAG